ncbi:MAG: hypothetical protein ABS46_06875 [Cytophagaceae bacterium SCN 52-12]|nr:MAG: hypothetical protein ABS46_06875 [Cytophagaceae bacterium SCN 52-12]
MSSETTDIELLALLRTGDHDAFTRIYQRYWESLYRSGYAILQDADVCDDIVQDIFVWLWNNREKHITDHLAPYLHAAVRYKVANVIRHGKIRSEYVEQAKANYHKAMEGDHNTELLELQEIIAQFTDRLPTRARQIFRMSREEFLSNREIAKQLGISEKTVENQINLTLNKLRIILGGKYFWSVLL